MQLVAVIFWVREWIILMQIIVQCKKMLTDSFNYDLSTTVYYLLLGELTLDPPMEKFVSLLDSLFDKLPYVLSESAGQIAGLDPTFWPHSEELVEPTMYVYFFICSCIFRFMFQFLFVFCY